MSTPQATVSIPLFVAFESGERESAIAVFVFALLSTLVLSLVLLCVAWVVFSTTFKRTTFQHLSREAFFFRSQLGQYATCLLLSNWLRGVSGSFDIQWVNAGGVKAGPSCTAQGALRQIGQFGSFFFIVAMGIHTFNTLVLHNRQPQWLGIVVTFVGWSSAVLIGVAPLSNSSRVSGPLYYIDGFTCGISKAYQVSHMLLYFLPLFLACLLSAIVYSLVFLMLRGTLVLNGGLRIHFGLERKLRLRNGTFEEYQRFIVSVSRTMLWLPISFVLALFPSSIVQLMDISGIAVSPGAMAFSYILEHLDSVINVLILFKVLRALGFAMKSTMSTDSEKGRSERGTISRPIYDWKPESKFAPATGPVTAPPVPPPFSMTEESVLHPASLAKSLFQTHKKALSANSSTGLLTTEPPLRSHSPSPNPELSPTAVLVQEPIAPASVLDAELDVPPEATQKHTQTIPQPNLPILDIPLLPDSSSTGLTPSPRGKRSRISRDPNLILGSPASLASSLSTPPFLEVTLHSPLSSPTGDGVGSLISMYLSQESPTTFELPPFPAAAVQRDSAIGVPLSNLPLKAAVSIGAVGGRKGRAPPPPPIPPHPKLPSASLKSFDESTDASHYSDSDPGTPPVLPPLPPTLPLRLSRMRSMDAQPRASRSSERPVFRALPLPPSRRVLRNPSVQSSASSLAPASSHSREKSSSSSHPGYL